MPSYYTTLANTHAALLCVMRHMRSRVVVQVRALDSITLDSIIQIHHRVLREEVIVGLYLHTFNYEGPGVAHSSN